MYSTDTGRITHKDVTHQPTPEGDGIVRIHRETKGRKGNGVSLITGITDDNKALKKIAKTLKQKLGVGGSVKQTTIEIQSDQREKLQLILEDMGYTVKIAGS